MPKPCLTLQHLKTSKQVNQQHGTIIRYWFEWSNRTVLSNVVVRLELLDADANKVTEASLQLPKVAITGYFAKDENGYQKPIYDSSVWIQVDDKVRDVVPVSFRYYTLEGLFKKSDVVEGVMSGVYEDISSLG